MPDGVVSIKKEAFEGCRKLTVVFLPDSITRIEKDVFKGCGNLQRVYVPKGEYHRFMVTGAFEGSRLKVLYEIDKKGKEYKPEISIERSSWSDVLDDIKEPFATSGSKLTEEQKAILVMTVLFAIFAFFITWLITSSLRWAFLVAPLVGPVAALLYVGYLALQEWINQGENGGGGNYESFESVDTNEENDDF